jgi:hypothetical protein
MRLSRGPHRFVLAIYLHSLPERISPMAYYLNI